MALATSVLEIESRAIKELIGTLDETFAKACRLCLETKGRVVVTGMGKSGHVGGKIAATLASTGTPSFFMHPAEASHGDLGMITADDLLLAVSYSGKTHEILTILPLVKHIGIKLISITGNSDSILAKSADVCLDVGISEEACPLNLAPTASTTATLVMGDALAVALLKSRGFTEEDFALSHPGGNLGKKLLLRVKDIMHAGPEIPAVSADTTLGNGLLEMSQKGLGMTAIVDPDNRILGIFTDGDLRRVLNDNVDLHKTNMEAIMQSNCITIAPHDMAVEAVHVLDENKITGLLVADDENCLVGALNIHDLFRAGVM
ncbi:MAG: D-arabinose 5-phosphate isomerase [Woeseia sp.]|nr:D-arabinose 5-phosphate isomerase [Woeseia sp.]